MSAARPARPGLETELRTLRLRLARQSRLLEALREVVEHQRELARPREARVQQLAARLAARSVKSG